MRPRFLLPVLLLLATTALSDIAPTEYSGRSLTPVSHSDIRMESETVDIFLGPPIADTLYVRTARVKAQFHMMNEGSDTSHVRVGFPVESAWRSRWFADLDVYDFTISVPGGRKIIPAAADVQGAYTYKRPSNHKWFGWDMAFPPGETVIDVEYGIITNHTYGRCYQNLGYVLYTGSYWKGPIGRAEINVHFPSDIEKEWIMDDRTTPGYRINSRRLEWVFKNFEPERGDDIRVEFMPPRLHSRIKEVESQLSKAPDDGSDLVSLARLYLKASYLKGYERGEYPDWAGKAEPLLREAVTRDPSNAMAWNIYLTSFCRMHIFTFGPIWNRSAPISPEQRKLIRTAFEHCPDDRGIALWHELADESKWELPATLGQFTRRDDRLVVLVSISNGGNMHLNLSDEEMSLILAYYDFKGNETDGATTTGWLERNSKTPTQGDRKKLNDALRKMFVNRIVDKLWRHNKAAGI